MKKIGFIGLRVMGLPMAQQLAKHFGQATVFYIAPANEARPAPLLRHLQRPGAVGQGSDVVFLCLPGAHASCIPVLLWTILPLYHMLLFAISAKDSGFAGKLWPDHPTLKNLEFVFQQMHHFLNYFWGQLWSSTLIAFMTGFLTLLAATSAAFAISRLRVRGGRMIMNLALVTYFIPAAFLAVPMYKAMGTYGLLDTKTAMILAMMALATPIAIWVLKQASDKLPVELDEATIVDGATAKQLFRLVYLPLILPSLVAIGTYAVLLAWNEYLYAFLLMSNEKEVPLPVALGLFMWADASPWKLLMTTGFIYAFPPAAVYYTFRRYRVSGLTAGAVKS